MKLSKLLRYQSVFFLTAIIYLGVSHSQIINNRPALSVADPLTSGIFLCTYALFLLSAFLENDRYYRILMGISVVGFGYGGVLLNIINYFQNGLDGYSSFTAWLIAVAINTYGLFFNLLATLGYYKK